MRRLLLYGTDGCHLCEIAADRVRQALPTRADPAALELIDIAADDALLARYGMRIPVLRRADGSELDWPFGAQELATFLSPD